MDSLTVLNQPQVPSKERAGNAGRGFTVWVTAREAFWVAMEALRSHKLRSFLTLLGVVIATTTLIVVMSIVNGMNLYIAEHIANLGTNTFVLHQFQWAQGFDSFLEGAAPQQADPHGGLRVSERQPPGIPAHRRHVPSSTPIHAARYKGHVIDEISVNGMTPSFADIGREKVEIRPLYQ